jgi:hypothetical protein
MKHTRIITAINSQLHLPAALLEEIVNHRTRKTRYHYPVTGIEKELYCSDLNAISTYSIETTIKGDLELECFNDKSAMIETVHVPVASSFLVTCVKGKEYGYKLKFSLSLN